MNVLVLKYIFLCLISPLVVVKSPIFNLQFSNLRVISGRILELVGTIWVKIIGTNKKQEYFRKPDFKEIYIS